MPHAKKVAKKNAKQVPENERFMQACSDIANALIQEYEAEKDSPKQKKDINLNKLRGAISRKHSLASQPPLTAIIAAVPEHYKKYILPKLIAKPIRKSNIYWPGNRANWLRRDLIWYRCRCCYVQATPMPTYRLHREYLRLLSWWS